MALIQDGGSICPQHWRNNQWQKTGDINPLPVETFIYNGTTWVPVSDTIPLPTKPQGRSSHVSLETNATTTEASSSFNVDLIAAISNDGTDNILFNFDANTSSAGTITLKPGEVLTDFPRKCTTIYYKALSGTQPFRAWGVK